MILHSIQEIGANLITFNIVHIFISREKNSKRSILKNEKFQVQSENKDCQFLLAEGMVDSQEKTYFGE